MIRAAFGIKISDAAANKAVRVTVIAKVTQWRSYVGATKVDERGIQIANEADFIIRHYGDLTLEELDLCIEMFVLQQLDMKERDFIIFSPMFISQVISRFQAYRKSQMLELNEKLAKIPPPQPEPPTADQRATDMRFMVNEVVRQINNGHVHVFLINDVFNFLLRTKKIVLDDDVINKAREFSDKMLKTVASTQDNQRVLDMMKNASPKKMRREFSMRYCIMEFVEKHGIDKVFDMITENDFKDNGKNEKTTA